MRAGFDIQLVRKHTVTTTESPKHALPYTEHLNGHAIEYRLMTPGDRSALLSFTQTLPREDVMFTRMDITKPDVIDHWIDNVEKGLSITVIALDDDRDIIGYASLHHNKMMWTRHLGELRMLVGPHHRGIGLGKRLTNEVFQIARASGLDRVFVQIPADQPHVRDMLQKMGFVTEALLTDWLMGGDNRTHDLIIMTRRMTDDE